MRIDPNYTANGNVLGVFTCREAETDRSKAIVALSGSVAEVESLLVKFGPLLANADTVIADPNVAPEFWGGKADPRFVHGETLMGRRMKETALHAWSRA